MKIFLLIFLVTTNVAFAQTEIVDTLKIRQDFENLINHLETNYVYYKSKDVDLIC